MVILTTVTTTGPLLLSHHSHASHRQSNKFLLAQPFKWETLTRFFSRSGDNDHPICNNCSTRYNDHCVSNPVLSRLPDNYLSMMLICFLENRHATPATVTVASGPATSTTTLTAKTRIKSFFTYTIVPRKLTMPDFKADTSVSGSRSAA